MIMLIKYRENFLFDPEYYSWQWAKVYPGVKNGKLVTRYRKVSASEAERVKRLEGLVLVEKGRGMELYDTPDHRFQRTYRKRTEVKDF